MKIQQTKIKGNFGVGEKPIAEHLTHSLAAENGHHWNTTAPVKTGTNRGTEHTGA